MHVGIDEFQLLVQSSFAGKELHISSWGKGDRKPWDFSVQATLTRPLESRNLTKEGPSKLLAYELVQGALVSTLQVVLTLEQLGLVVRKQHECGQTSAWKSPKRDQSVALCFHKVTGGGIVACNP